MRLALALIRIAGTLIAAVTLVELGFGVAAFVSVGLLMGVL